MSTDKLKLKRKVFVASSDEHKKLAQAVEHFVNKECSDFLECDAWTSVTGKAGDTLVERLRRWVQQYHIGIFIFAPDDLLHKPHPDYQKRFKVSGTEHAVARDNVIFELGGWIAFAGIHRAYALIPKSPQVKPPSDIGGVLGEPYEYSHALLEKDIADIATKLAAPVREIANAIRKNDADNAQNRFRESIEELQERIAKEVGQDPLEAVRQLCIGLRNTLTDKVLQLSDQEAVENYLKDLLLWVRTSLDALDHAQLAVAQASKTKQVWVYAPEPLETVVGARAVDVLRTVAENIAKRNVKYTYFVEDQTKGIPRILKLAEDLKGSLDSVPGNWDKLVKANLQIVVLRPEHFLSYYTVHFYAKGTPAVFQSILRDDRDDLLVKLDLNRAAEVTKMVAGLLKQATKKTNSKGFTVLSLP